MQSDLSGGFVIDALGIDPGPVGEPIQEGHTIGGQRSSVEAVTYNVHGDSGLHLSVADITWENGERDIRAIREVRGPRELRRLEHGLRMGVTALAEGRVWAELSQPQIKRQGVDVWSNLKRAGWQDLEIGSGADAAETLQRVGTLKLGTRRSLLGPSGSRSMYLVAVFQENNHLGLVEAYVLTRVLPLLRGFSGSQLTLAMD